MPDLRTILGIAVAALLAFRFWRYVQGRRERAAATPGQLFGEIVPLLEHPRLAAGEAIGTWQVTGAYRGHAFQLKAVTDTLAVRKLPSLWLMVTLPSPQPVSATFDLMMRPQGPSTFSNFDFLDHTLPTPPGFPEDAVIRSDQTAAAFPADAVRREMASFQALRGKEVLVSPKGLRIVLQAGEADRARYGVFREADFGDRRIPARHAREAMDMLLTISEKLPAS